MDAKAVDDKAKTLNYQHANLQEAVYETFTDMDDETMARHIAILGLATEISGDAHFAVQLGAALEIWGDRHGMHLAYQLAKDIGGVMTDVSAQAGDAIARGAQMCMSRIVKN